MENKFMKQGAAILGFIFLMAALALPAMAYNPPEGVCGTVYQDNGSTPLSGASVELCKYTYSSGNQTYYWLHIASTTTATDGTWQVAYPYTGTYQVRVTATGYWQVRNQGVLSGNTPGGMLLINVGEITNHRINFPVTGVINHSTKATVDVTITETVTSSWSITGAAGGYGATTGSDSSVQWSYSKTSISSFGYGISYSTTGIYDMYTQSILAERCISGTGIEGSIVGFTTAVTTNPGSYADTRMIATLSSATASWSHTGSTSFTVGLSFSVSAGPISESFQLTATLSSITSTTITITIHNPTGSTIYVGDSTEGGFIHIWDTS